MKQLKIVTQLDSMEKGKPGTADDWLDDCGWASMAFAANALTGTTFKSKDGIAWGEQVGRHDRDGLPDPTSLAQMAKAAPICGLKATYPKSWGQVLESAKAGAVIAMNVEQPKGYPATVQLSAWHKRYAKRHPGTTYGHMVMAAALDGAEAQFACPTMTGKGPEAYAVPVSWEDLKAIASSKGDAPHKRCLILVAKSRATAAKNRANT